MQCRITMLCLCCVDVDGLVVEQERDDVEVGATDSQVKGTCGFFGEMVIVFVCRLKEGNEGLLVAFSQGFEQLEAVDGFSD